MKQVLNELKIKPAGDLGEEERTLIEQKYARYKDKIEKARNTAKPDTAFNDILGFMPLRRDFDYEYDNEAELFLAEMEFSGKLECPDIRGRPARRNRTQEADLRHLQQETERTH